MSRQYYIERVKNNVRVYIRKQIHCSNDMPWTTNMKERLEVKDKELAEHLAKLFGGKVVAFEEGQK